MIEGLEARVETLAAERTAMILAALAAAEPPSGLVIERRDGAIVVRGRGLVRRLAFDPWLRMIAMIARQA